MKLSSIARLYRVRLRARIVQELFAVVGIAIGVALLFASQVASTSLDRSAQQLTRGIVGQMRFQLAARDAHGFDERLLSQVQAIPGVRMTVPERYSAELETGTTHGSVEAIDTQFRRKLGVEGALHLDYDRGVAVARLDPGRFRG